MALVATTAKEVFDNICERFQPSKAGTDSAMFRFDLSGEMGGQFWAHIMGGTCAAGEGVPPTPADITIIAAGEDFIRLVNQQLQPMIALMQGKIKVQGSMGTALKMISWFDLA